jgi:anaerobic ribonucleoside-triphosphate reductase
MQIRVIKKNDETEFWNNSKIINAIIKAADHIGESIPNNILTQIAEYCQTMVNAESISTIKIHSIVVNALKHFNYNDIAEAYYGYRNYKATDYATWRKLKEEADDIIHLGDRENANFDSSLISTKGSLIRGSTTKRLYQEFELNKTEKFLTKRGDIYIHDMRDMIFGSINCCLFDIGNVLKDGFTMSNIHYNEPKSVLSALQVIGDITLVATAQQFGGFTLAEIDKVLLPYVKKSFNRSFDIHIHRGINKLDAERYAIEDTITELKQGFQSLELKLNTVPCSRGDFAFTTLTFGQWDTNISENDKFWLKEIGKSILKTRKKGHNGVSVVFPKLVYLYDENQIANDHYSSELFDDCIKTSAKCMYPDYLSLSGDIEHNKVAQEFKNYGTIVSPMGCIDYNERVNIKRSKYFSNVKIGDLFNHYYQKNGRPANWLETKFEHSKGSKNILNEHNFSENGYASFDGDLVNLWARKFKETIGRKPCRIDFEEHFGIQFPRRNVRVERGYDVSLFSLWDSYLELKLVDDLKYSGYTEKMYKEECLTEKDFVRNSKFTFNGKTYEIDVFFPKLNYGIEVQDFATHSKNSDTEYSEKGYHKRGPKYHEEKREYAKQLGIEIVDLWEDKIRSNDYADLKLSVTHKGFIEIKNTFDTFSNEVSDVLNLENLNISIQDIDGTYTKLKRIIRNKNVTNWLKITFENGATIRVTEDHPFVTDNGQILANELEINSFLMNENEEPIKITNIETDNEVGYSYDVQTESETFVFSGVASHNCRAYLSHWEDPETKESITVGRCNIGAVSLNIPVIMAVAKQEYGSEWKSKFWPLLESRLQTIRQFLCKRYDFIASIKASTNPLAFTQGGFYGGTLNPDDCVGNLTRYMTASFGITALNESTVLWNGKTIYEDKSQFASKVIDFILEKIEKFKKEDNHLYALYGTPAESLCGKQAVQYAELTGDTRFGDYFTNSFHCHVGANITPVDKQDAEFECFHKVNGGHIQYVRIDNPENLEALKTIIVRGMQKGFYQGVNFDSSHCNECGFDYQNGGNKCPHCGSSNTTTISRVCGYLGYSNVNGSTRMNDAKMSEIKDRVSM